MKLTQIKRQAIRAHRTEDGNIILEPFTEIPAREKWLFDNEAALGAVKVGLENAAGGIVRSPLRACLSARVDGLSALDVG